MHIHTGLFDHMVLQRDRNNKSLGRVTGETDAAINAPVVARVRLNKRTVPGFARKTVGHAKNRKFAAALAGLPVGGPYTIELFVGDETMMATDVLVGDVWIAAGQSNMHGCGLLVNAAKPQPLCRAFSVDDQWNVAQDPINDIAVSVDPVHADLVGGTLPAPNRIIGTGPAIAFGQEILRATGVPQGIIASSHGGTSMEQWDPAKKSLGGKSLYGATLRRFEKNGGAIAGIIWYQGESESHAPAFQTYPQKMKRLVAAFRRDFRSPRLPIAIVQIARLVGQINRPEWNAVQDMQRLLPDTISHFTTVPAIDLPLDDSIHISGHGHQRLGRRLANAMLTLLSHPGAQAPPIALGAMQVRAVPERDFAEVIVQFNHVVGKLHAGAARPTGFALLDENQTNLIFDTRLDGNRVILRTIRPATALAGKTLYYGYGNDPYCNVTDAADRSLPVFTMTLPTRLGKGKK